MNHRKRIFDGLSNNCSPYNKRFWEGFIIALADTGQISIREHHFLLETIVAWKKGDTDSRYIMPWNINEVLEYENEEI